MRGSHSRARGVAAWLVAGVLGLTGGAWAQSPACGCNPTNPSIVSEQPCLVIEMAACGESQVTNACDVAVTLEDWPLQECPSRRCSVSLPPGESAAFDYANLNWRGEEFFAEESYRVMVDGEARDVTITADVVCPARPPEREKEGCASAPGALAALGMLLLAGPLLRPRG